jgi:hypothetical protein
MLAVFFRSMHYLVTIGRVNLLGCSCSFEARAASKDPAPKLDLSMETSHMV